MIKLTLINGRERYINASNILEAERRNDGCWIKYRSAWKSVDGSEYITYPDVQITTECFKEITSPQK